MNHYRVTITISCLSLMLCVCLINIPAFGTAAQEFQTLELVRTYQSEEEFLSANAKLLQTRKPIVDDGEYINFIDLETRNVLKQIKKEPTGNMKR